MRCTTVSGRCRTPRGTADCICSELSAMEISVSTEILSRRWCCVRKTATMSAKSRTRHHRQKRFQPGAQWIFFTVSYHDDRSVSIKQIPLEHCRKQQLLSWPPILGHPAHQHTGDGIAARELRVLPWARTKLGRQHHSGPVSAKIG